MLGRARTSLLATFDVEESLPNDRAPRVSLMSFLWSPPTPVLIGVGWNAPQSGNLQLSRSALSPPQQSQCHSPAPSSEILDLLHPSPAESTASAFEVFIFIPASSHLTQQMTCSDTPPCAATQNPTDSRTRSDLLQSNWRGLPLWFYWDQNRGPDRWRLFHVHKTHTLEHPPEDKAPVQGPPPGQKPLCSFLDFSSVNLTLCSASTWIFCCNRGSLQAPDSTCEVIRLQCTCCRLHLLLLTAAFKMYEMYDFSWL